MLQGRPPRTVKFDQRAERRGILCLKTGRPGDRLQRRAVFLPQCIERLRTQAVLQSERIQQPDRKPQIAQLEQASGSECLQALLRKQRCV